MDQQLKGFIRQFVDEITKIPDEQFQDEDLNDEVIKKFDDKVKEFKDITTTLSNYMGLITDYLRVRFYYNDALRALNKILDDETGEEIHELYNKLKCTKYKSIAELRQVK